MIIIYMSICFSLRYLSFGSNEEQKFSFSECKSVPINKCAEYIRLLFFANYTNSYNVGNQIGIRAIKAEGELISQSTVCFICCIVRRLFMFLSQFFRVSMQNIKFINKRFSNNSQTRRFLLPQTVPRNLMHPLKFLDSIRKWMT